jgi:hypothetical protein
MTLANDGAAAPSATMVVKVLWRTQEGNRRNVELSTVMLFACKASRISSVDQDGGISETRKTLGTMVVVSWKWSSNSHHSLRINKPFQNKYL